MNFFPDYSDNMIIEYEIATKGYLPAPIPPSRADGSEPDILESLMYQRQLAKYEVSEKMRMREIAKREFQGERISPANKIIIFIMSVMNLSEKRDSTTKKIVFFMSLFAFSTIGILCFKYNSIFNKKPEGYPFKSSEDSAFEKEWAKKKTELLKKYI